MMQLNEFDSEDNVIVLFVILIHNYHKYVTSGFKLNSAKYTARCASDQEVIL